MTALGSFSAGDVLTAADLNAIGTWTDFTPSFATGLTVGNATVEAKYTTINELTFVYVDVLFGLTTAVTGVVRMDLPVSAVATSAGTFAVAAFLQGNAYDATTAAYFKLMGQGFSSASVRIQCMSTAGTAVAALAMSATVPFTWTTGDHLTFTLYYRSA